MAILGFKGLGWFLCCAIVAPASYIVTSQGATERSRLASVESRIIAARKDIRNLETEFNTRANMAQLEQWNGEVLALNAPAPGQYLANENALAELDSAPAREVQVAQLVVPAGAPKAVVTPAVATTVKHGPAGTAQATGMNKARSGAIAMLDDKLLDELKQRAQAEQLALR